MTIFEGKAARAMGSGSKIELSISILVALSLIYGIFHIPDIGADSRLVRVPSNAMAGRSFISLDEPRQSIQSAGGDVDQVHLAWIEDSATTFTAAWHTIDSSAASELEYRPVGSTSWFSVTGASKAAHDGGLFHEATVSGLDADRAYDYRLPDGASGWTKPFTTTTAPLTGTSGLNGFNVVYVADTGLAGRLDGLASGTEAVKTAIQSLSPRLILGGGDYAYYNTDNRYPSLEDAIDAWFNQMQPLASAAPLMPAYGNHEYNDADDADGYDEWAYRFPTPPGFDGQRFYSFNVGNAHFISIYAPVGTISDAALQWIEDDILAAQASGQTWIIPYFHIAPFSDGSNHSSSYTLRNQLGSMFEQLGVRLVLTAHDQSYERTYPLADVPATNSPTSTRRECYAPGEGVIWLKASPGGKLSNVNWDFSQFLTFPAPDYTAVRTNKLHHFVELQFNSDGTLTVNSWGVPERGGGALPVDRFQLTNAPCDPELRFDPAVLEKRLDFDSHPATISVHLSASDGALPVGINLQSDSTWLTAVPVGGGDYTLEMDASGLAPGTYPAELTAQATGYLPARLPVILIVNGNTAGYHIQVSQQADRSSPVDLHGQTVSGNVYIFTAPDLASIGEVRFFIDQQKYRRESTAPYDLAGTDPSDQAYPYDTTQLIDGWHRITAVVVSTDGSSELASARFRVENHAGPDLMPPDTVIISGAMLGDVNITHTFTASVAPISTTLPLTYTWAIVGQAPIIHSGGLTDTFDVAWNETGSQQVEVKVGNTAGFATDLRSIFIHKPLPAAVAPSAVTIDGPTSGDIGMTYTFTATVSPISTTLPLTYTWMAADQLPVIQTGGLTGISSFNWETPGTKQITITVSDQAGEATGSRTIIVAPLNFTIVLPLVMNGIPAGGELMKPDYPGSGSAERR